MTHAVLPADKVTDAAKLALAKAGLNAGLDYANRLKLLIGLAQAAYFYAGDNREITVTLEDFALILETYVSGAASAKPSIQRQQPEDEGDNWKTA